MAKHLVKANAFKQSAWWSINASGHLCSSSLVCAPIPFDCIYIRCVVCQPPLLPFFAWEACKVSACWAELMLRSARRQRVISLPYGRTSAAAVVVDLPSTHPCWRSGGRHLDFMVSRYRREEALLLAKKLYILRCMIIPFSNINIIVEYRQQYWLTCWERYLKCNSTNNLSWKLPSLLPHNWIIFLPQERLSENTERRLINCQCRTRAAKSEVWENAGNRAEFASWFERSALNHDSKPRLIARPGLPNVL